MSKVDWSKAPEGATHLNRTGRFFKFDVIGAAGIAHTYLGGKWLSIGYRLEDYSEPGELTERPKPKQWSGQQDGLPPVNTACEVIEGPAYWEGLDCEKWPGSEVTVKATFANGVGQSIAAVERDDGECSCFIIECLAPIKTPSQLAAEQRETSIREIMDAAGIDCRVTAARLVDAGFKREVV